MKASAQLTHFTCDSTTLDAFADARKLQGIDLVKIDTEATEPQVLAGTATISTAIAPKCSARSCPDSESKRRST